MLDPIGQDLKVQFDFIFAEILFDGREVSRRMCHKYPYRHKQNLEILKACKTDEEMEEWMEHNASHILDMLATEVDRLEQIIRVILH